MLMYLWPYLHVWWMSINYFELFCSDPGQCCVRVYLSCASAERDIHNNIIWIRPIFTGGSHKNLAGFHPKISTSLFSHTCTHRWNRLVFTQCYNSTGQDCRHNSVDRIGIPNFPVFTGIKIIPIPPVYVFAKNRYTGTVFYTGVVLC